MKYLLLPLLLLTFNANSAQVYTYVGNPYDTLEQTRIWYVSCAGVPNMKRVRAMQYVASQNPLKYSVISTILKNPATGVQSAALRSSATCNTTCLDNWTGSAVVNATASQSVNLRITKGGATGAQAGNPLYFGQHLVASQVWCETTSGQLVDPPVLQNVE